MFRQHPVFVGTCFVSGLGESFPHFLTYLCGKNGIREGLEAGLWGYTAKTSALECCLNLWRLASETLNYATCGHIFSKNSVWSFTQNII